MTNPQPSRKRWRIAVAVVVLFAAVGSLVAWPAYKRHRAIQEIERLSGEVLREPVGPKWLSRWGIRVTHVNIVALDGTEITDDGLKHLSSLTDLEWLFLNNTKISDGGLKHLSGLTNLEVLSLVGTSVSDDGVKILQESLPNCRIDWPNTPL